MFVTPEEMVKQLRASGFDVDPSTFAGLQPASIPAVLKAFYDASAPRPEPHRCSAHPGWLQRRIPWGVGPLGSVHARYCPPRSAG